MDVDSVRIVAVGDDADADESSLDGVEVDEISSPSDLPGLGITISRILSEHDDFVVCFDSVTHLLQSVDIETAYAFLHTVTGQLYATDARAHFHLDPSEHDRQTIDVITSLFDAVVDDDREPRITARSLLQEK